MQLVSSDPKLLYVNATSLASDLRRAFEEIEPELRNDPELRDRFYKRDRKNRELHLDRSDAARWRAALENAPVSSRALAASGVVTGRNRPAGRARRPQRCCGDATAEKSCACRA